MTPPFERLNGPTIEVVAVAEIEVTGPTERGEAKRDRARREAARSELSHPLHVVVIPFRWPIDRVGGRHAIVVRAPVGLARICTQGRDQLRILARSAIQAARIPSLAA